MESAAVFAQILYGIAGVFCLFYYLPCALYWGWYGKELAAVLAVGLGSFGLLISTEMWGMNFLLWLCFAIFLLCLCVFLWVEGKVFRAMCQREAANVSEWILVPGYKPRKGHVPVVLTQRVDKAAALLRSREESKAILSGGFTDGAVSEAMLMQRLLNQRGIEEARTVLEDASTTTQENMSFCYQLTGGRAIGLVSNGFHLYRACGEARKAGFAHVQGYHAGNGPGYLLPYHMAREFMTIVNDKMQGYL